MRLIVHPFKNYCLSTTHLPSTVILGAVNSGANKSNEISLLMEFTFCYEGTGNGKKLENWEGNELFGVNEISINVDSTYDFLWNKTIKLGASASTLTSKVIWSQVRGFLDFYQIMWVYLNIQGGKMRETKIWDIW